MDLDKNERHVTHKYSPINKGFCYNRTNVTSWDNFPSYDDSFFISLWVKHSCFGNYKGIIFSTRLLAMICNIRNYTVEQNQTAGLVYKDRLHQFYAPMGLWYLISVSVTEDGTLKVTINDQSATINEVKAPNFTFDKFLFGIGNIPVCYDSVAFHSDPRFAINVAKMYQTYIYGE